MSEGSSFVDDRHTLYVGWVLGIALRNGVDAVPVLDEAGNYTDRIAIRFGDWSLVSDNLASDNMRVTVVVPPPPQDWELVDHGHMP